MFTQRWHGRWSLNGVQGVRKFHTAPTSRIAVIAVVLGVIVEHKHAPTEVATFLWPMLISVLPEFLRFVENLTEKVGVHERFFRPLGAASWPVG